MSKFTSKKFDFYILKYVFNKKEDMDFTRMNKYLEEMLEKYNASEDFEFIKSNKTTYIGFNYIEKYTYEQNNLWIFCLSKTVTTKLAVVNEIDKTVKVGRSEYGDKPTQGLTSDTVVLFDPKSGIVIIPSNRGGISQSDFKQFLYKTVRKKGAVLKIAINNTDIDNISNIDNLNEIKFNIARIIDSQNTTNSKMSSQQDKKMIDKLNADTLTVSYKSSNLNISESVKYIKKILKKDPTKEVKNMIVVGENDGREQIIDLIGNRLIYIDDKVTLNDAGKLEIKAMVESIKKAFEDNYIIISKDIL